MMTACAGRFTPQARVAVQTRTWREVNRQLFIVRIVHCTNVQLYRCCDCYLNKTLTEIFLHQVPVRPQHPGVVDPEAGWEQFLNLRFSLLCIKAAVHRIELAHHLQLLVPAALHGVPGDAELRVVHRLEAAQLAVLRGFLLQHQGGLRRAVPGVHEDHDLEIRLGYIRIGQI